MQRDKVSDTYEIRMSPVLDYLDNPTRYLQPNDLNKTVEGEELSDEDYKQYLIDNDFDKGEMKYH